MHLFYVSVGSFDASKLIYCNFLQVNRYFLLIILEIFIVKHYFCTINN